MKERPIPCTTAEVNAMLAGRQTQFRRVMRGQPYTLRSEGWGFPTRAGGFVSQQMILDDCPYGVPGDRLWVREKWASPEADVSRMGRVAYDADGWACAWLGDGGGGKLPISHGRILEASGYREFFPESGSDTYGLKKYGGRWRSPLHMPRWASRLTLEITDIRVQRLQEISEEDAEAEGVEHWVVGEGWREYGLPPQDEAVCGPPMPTAKDSFRTRWDSINAKRGHGWEKNDWVWAVSFKRAPAEVTA